MKALLAVEFRVSCVFGDFDDRDLEEMQDPNAPTLLTPALCDSDALAAMLGRGGDADGGAAANGVICSKLYANGVYDSVMEFIETPTFTRQVTELLSDDEYRQLQNRLLADPAFGELLRGGGGIRKVRHALQGRGRSGGVRAIYYWIKDQHKIYMLVVYPKSKKDDLSDRETAILRELVKEL